MAEMIVEIKVEVQKIGAISMVELLSTIFKKSST
jgi:hypothetical protein